MHLFSPTRGQRRTRFEHALTVWLDCDQGVLDPRLDARVDDMVRTGALAEMQQLWDELCASGVDGTLSFPCAAVPPSVRFCILRKT